MTSAARTSEPLRRGGFTLLEMMLVLVVAMMIIGSALGLLYYNRDEARLNGMVSELEVFAKRARAVASLQQRPYALEFTREGVAMMPLAEAMVAPEDRAGFAMMEEERALATGRADGTGVRAALALEPDTRLEILRWAAGDWRPVGPRDRHVWRFDPNGIAEPIGVRFQMENGNWIAAMFHPLSASVADLEYQIQ